jgi:hypothetical protein
VPLDVIAEHAKEHVSPNPRLDPVMHGPELQIDDFNERNARSTRARFL